MTEFSEKLKFLVKQNGHSTASIAKQCNIERTVFHKYGTGDRLPPSYQTVETIAEKLLLSADDRGELLMLWQMEQFGKEVFSQRIKIKNLLENLNSVSTTAPLTSHPIAETVTSPLKEVQQIESELELIMYLRYILSQESAKPNFHIKICAQPIYSNILNLFLEYSVISNMTVTQLVCFHQRQHTIVKNIDYLDQILSMAFRVPNYKLKVYYDDADFHINSMSLLPNLIVTEEYVILFSFDQKEGIIYHKKEIHTFYDHVFEKLSVKCRNASTNTHTHEDYIDIILHKDYHYFLNQNPCMGIGFTEEFLDKVIINELPDRDLFIQSILNDTARRSVDYMNNPCQAFFTNCGVRHFIQTGRDNEYPPELYRQITKDEAKELIKNYCDQGNNFFVHNKLINDSLFHYQSNVIIHAELNGIVLFQKPEDQFERKFVIIDEPSISTIFVDFFASLEGMNYVKSNSESRSYLYSLVL